jgi:hypothetical protein
MYFPFYPQVYQVGSSFCAFCLNYRMCTISMRANFPALLILPDLLTRNIIL